MCITNHMCSLKSTGDPRPTRLRIGVRKNGFNPRDLDVKLAYQRLGYSLGFGVGRAGGFNAKHGGKMGISWEYIVRIFFLRNIVMVDISGSDC